MPIKPTTSQAEILAKGITLFGDIDKVREWMKKKNPALEGQKPITLMDTAEGRETVLLIMEQLEG